QQVVAARGLEPLGAVFTDRLKHQKPAGVDAPGKALVDERLEALDVCAADALGRLECPAAAKDRERLEQPLLPGFEELVRPLDPPRQRSLWSLGAAAPPKQVEPVPEAVEQLRCRQERRARGRQLDRQREIVEAGTQLVDVLVRLELGEGRSRARDEQL